MKQMAALTAKASAAGNSKALKDLEDVKRDYFLGDFLPTCK